MTGWNGPSGLAWVAAEALLDQLYVGFEPLLVDAVAAAGARRVIDVGCGTGRTTVAVATRLGGDADCLGVDISAGMIAAAQARAQRDGVSARFICADAQDYAFEPATIDAIVSRFGVMFFSDPVAAFTNLRRAARAGAVLRLIAWRGPAENSFMTAAERAAAPLLPGLPERLPDEPGQFGFSDPHRVRRILEDSGWVDVDVQPIDVPCTMPEKDLIFYLTRLGPVGLALHDVDEPTRTRIVDVVRPAFDPYVQGADVRFTAACWMIAGRAPS